MKILSPVLFSFPHHQKEGVRKGGQVGGRVREEGFILKEFQLKTNMTTVPNSQILKHMDKKW